MASEDDVTNLEGQLRCAEAFHDVAVKERDVERQRVDELGHALGELVAAVNVEMASHFCLGVTYCAESQRCKDCLYERTCRAMDVAEKVLRRYERILGKAVA